MGAAAYTAAGPANNAPHWMYCHPPARGSGTTTTRARGRAGLNKETGMASYTVPVGHIGAYAKTLVAATADTVTFALGSTGTPGWANVPKSLKIVTDGAAALYFTTDGSTPTVAGTNTYEMAAAAGSVTVSVVDSNAQDAVVVKLISAGTPKYSVSKVS